MGRDNYTYRLCQLCTAFKLPTVGAEAVPRFRQAGHEEALETLLEVLELEAEDRASSGRSAGCVVAQGYRWARPGRPLSTTDSQPGCSGNCVNWPGETSWNRA
jgi:predicted signal transduction protein with EAL and GGDEF domain